MKKTIFSTWILACLFTFTTQAQHYLPQGKVWAMGAYAGLDFNGPGNPVPITSAMNGLNNEGCASVCDEDGHLLFYSNGHNVWTASHTIMPNGANIDGFSAVAPTATQGTLIVPFPGVKNKFYLFNLVQTSGLCKLYCNVVDMMLNSGHGDVDTSFLLAGVPLEDSLSEKMTAARGCNNDVWVLAHKRFGDKFLAFRVTATGVTLTPVVSNFSILSDSDYFFGAIKVSPGGDKLMLCYPWLFLYTFDPYTGQISNRTRIDSTVYYYSGAFSPNGTKLYARSAILQASVYQFDLNATVPFSTKTALGTVATLVNTWADMKLGPDNKIYVGSNTNTITTTGGFRHLSRINNPDNAGLACNFEEVVPGIDFTTIGTGNSALMIGLPNEIVMADASAVGEHRTVMDTVICQLPASGLWLEAASGFSDYQWNDMSTTTSKNITAAGTYWVRYRTGICHLRTDTFKIKGQLITPQIVFSNNTLSTTQTYATYQWYKGGTIITGATGQSCAATGNGWYSVAVSNAYSCTDSAAYLVGGTGMESAGSLKNFYIRIYPNPAHDKIFIESPVAVRVYLYHIEGKMLADLKGKTMLDISTIANGLYFIHICDKEGRRIKTEKLVVRHSDQ